MDERKTRTIFIVTLTVISFFILTSWIFPGLVCGRSAFEFFFGYILRYGCFAVIPFALFVFAVMWDWTVSVGWKPLIAFLHIFFALAALFWIWVLWLIDWSEVDLSGLA